MLNPGVRKFQHIPLRHPALGFFNGLIFIFFLLVALTVGHARKEQDGHGANRKGLERSQGGRPSDRLRAQRPLPHSSPPGELRLLGIIQLVCFDFCAMNVIV